MTAHAPVPRAPAPPALLLLLSAACLLAACGRDEATVVVNPDGQTAYRTGPDGAEVKVARDGESLEVGDELPAFAPVYPGATVKTRMADVKGSGARGGMWVMESADSVEKIAAFYDEQAKKAGVKPGMFVNDKDSAVRIFGSNDSASPKAEGALIAISRDAGENVTKIVITAGTAISKADRAVVLNEPQPYPAAPQRLQ